jgi:Protein of unknown function (DUF3987)
MTTAVLKSFGARLLKILETPQPTARGKLNELEPRELPLSDDAIALWFDFVRHVEGSICRGGSLEPIRGLANKLPEHAARLAAVITLVSNFSAGEIDVGALRCGVTLAEHYATEALRIFEGSKIDPHLLLAQRLLNWLYQRPEEVISLPDIYQRSLNAIGDQATARALVATLADHGWLVPIEGGAVVAGQRRREVWRIVRV